MSFFEELKRRNVFRVAIAYVVASWLLLQVTDVLVSLMGLPEVAGKIVVMLVVIGFIPVLIFSWAYEVTPEGIKRESEVERSESITRETAARLNRLTIGLLLAVAALVIADRFLPGEANRGTDRVTDVAAETSQVAQPPGPAAVPEPVEDNSIAVLPFANRSNLEDDLFFTDGIHDDLLTQLAKIADLKVISRTSVMEYRDTTKKIPEIAAELGVGKILEGGVQRAGKRIRINAQLIDVATDEHLWAETYDREMTLDNIFDIQSEITRQIVTAVRGELTETEQKALADTPTDNLEAWEAYLHARAAMNRADYTKEKYIEAEPWAKTAVELDPGFAEAWALLAEIHAQAVWIGYDTSPERFEAAKEARDRAVSLKPESAAAKRAEADYLYRFDNDYSAALEKYREAADLAPGDAQIQYELGFTLRRLGRWDESIAAFERSLDIDPANVYSATQVVDTLYWMKDFERIDKEVGQWIIRYPDSNDMKGHRVLAMLFARGDVAAAKDLYSRLQPWVGYIFRDVAQAIHLMDRDYEGLLRIYEMPELVEFYRGSNQYDVMFQKARAHYLSGDEQKAQEQFRELINTLLSATPQRKSPKAFNLAYTGVTYAHLGEFEQALEYSRQALDLYPPEVDHLFGAAVEQMHTMVLAMSGKRDEAIEILERTVGTPRGFSRWRLWLDPTWDFFRDDPRFVELARPLNLNEARP